MYLSRIAFLLCAILALVIIFDMAEEAEADTLDLAPYAINHKNFKLSTIAADTKPYDLKISFLDYTFSKNRKKLNKLLKSGRVKYLQIHLVNTVCLRNRNCGKYETFNDSLNATRKYLDDKNKKKLKKFIKRSKAQGKWLKKQVVDRGITCRISPFLEHNFSKRQFLNGVELVKDSFPKECKWVNNPVEGNRVGRFDGFIHEDHHSDVTLKAPCIANLDGEDIKFPGEAALSKRIDVSKIDDFERRFSQCEAQFLWHRQSNGIEVGRTIDPRKRSQFVTSKHIEQIKKHTSKKAKQSGSGAPERPKKPSACTKFEDGAKVGNVWKDGDHDSKAVVLFDAFKHPKKFPYVSVLNKKGKQLDSFYSTGFSNADRGRERQTWRSRSKSIKQYPKRGIELHTSKECYFISNPRRRAD